MENSSYRNTFFLLIFQLNLHQAYVLNREKHGEGSFDFLFTEHLTLNRENFSPSSYENSSYGRNTT
jgi:hypothetical protein